MAMRLTRECTRCGACLERCPRRAFSERDGAYTLDARRCDDCAGLPEPACLAACPTPGALVPASHARLVWLDRVMYGGMCAAAMALSGWHFLAYTGRMPLESPTDAATLWLLYPAAALFALVGLGLPWWLLSEGQAALARAAGLLLGAVLAVLAGGVLRYGGGLPQGALVLGLAWSVWALALLRRPREASG